LNEWPPAGVDPGEGIQYPGAVKQRQPGEKDCRLIYPPGVPRRTEGDGGQGSRVAGGQDPEQNPEEPAASVDLDQGYD